MIVRNISSAIKYLNDFNTHNAEASRSMEKISSAKRINSAADDVAGLAVHEKNTLNILGYRQAKKNLQDGISIVQTAENSIVDINNILNDIRKLVLQAANDTMSAQDRQFIQDDIDEKVNTINDIATSVKFNGHELLTGDVDWEDQQQDITQRNVQDLAFIGQPVPGIYKVYLNSSGSQDSPSMTATTSTHVDIASEDNYDYTTSLEKPNNSGVVNLHTATTNSTDSDIGILDTVLDSSANVLYDVQDNFGAASDEYDWDAVTGNLTVNNTSGDGIISKTGKAGGADAGAWKVQLKLGEGKGYNLVSANTGSITVIDPDAEFAGVTVGSGLSRVGSNTNTKNVTNEDSTVSGNNELTLTYKGDQVAAYTNFDVKMADTRTTADLAGQQNFYLDPTNANNFSGVSTGNGLYIANPLTPDSEGSSVPGNGIINGTGLTEVAWGTGGAPAAGEIKINYSTGQVKAGSVIAGGTITYIAGCDYNVDSSNTGTGKVSISGGWVDPNQITYDEMLVDYDVKYYKDFTITKFTNEDGSTTIHNQSVNNASGNFTDEDLTLTDAPTGTLSVDYQYNRKYSTGNGDSFSVSGDVITITNGAGDNISDPADNFSKLAMDYTYYDAVQAKYYDLGDDFLTNSLRVSQGAGTALETLTTTTEEMNTYEVSGDAIRLNYADDSVISIEFANRTDTPVTYANGINTRLGEDTPSLGGDSTANGTDSVFNDFWSSQNITLTVDNNTFSISINPSETISDLIDRLNTAGEAQRENGIAPQEGEAYLTEDGGSNAGFTASWTGSNIQIVSDYKGSRFNIISDNNIGADLEHLIQFQAGAGNPVITVTDPNNQTYTSTAPSNFFNNNNTDEVSGIPNTRIRIKEDAESGTESFVEILSFNLQTGPGFGDERSLTIADMRAATLGIDNIDVTSSEGIQSAISNVNNALDNCNTARAQLGAYINRFENTMKNLNIREEQASIADSNIMSADLAGEMMQFSKSKMIANAALGTIVDFQFQSLQRVLDLFGNNKK